MGPGNVAAKYSSGSIGGQSLQQTTDAAPNRSVMDGLGGTEQRLAALHDAISSIAKQIDPLLTPSVPGKDANPSPAPTCSHVYGRVSGINESIAAALLRLFDLQQRIEL